ncbi:conserved hypothetical protein [uncultured Desulfatiglans sp.]|nr:conserved hypothetical protein [uncultured Desulfatiglans sp.]
MEGGEKNGLVSVDKAERFLGIKKGTLANWRYHGRGPAYYKVGRRVFYAEKDLNNWLKATRVLTADCRD